MFCIGRKGPPLHPWREIRNSLIIPVRQFQMGIQLKVTNGRSKKKTKTFQYSKPISFIFKWLFSLPQACLWHRKKSQLVSTLLCHVLLASLFNGVHKYPVSFNGSKVWTVFGCLWARNVAPWLYVHPLHPARTCLACWIFRIPGCIHSEILSSFSDLGQPHTLSLT